MSANTRHAGDMDTRLVIQPNASLSDRQARIFLGVMFLVMMGSGIGWALAGYWLVLPFSGLEFLALWAGLAWSMRGNAYREVISFDGDDLAIEKGRYQPEARWVFKRAGARVRLEKGRFVTSPTRLLVTAPGRSCEVGACLTDEERELIAGRLRALVGRLPAVDRPRQPATTTIES